MKFASRLSSTMILMASAWFIACSPSGDAPGGEDGGAAHDGAVLPFIADDYDAALAAAREQNIPIFVDTWAPW